MTSLLIFTIDHEDIDPMILEKRDTLQELDEYISSKYEDESDIINSGIYSKKITAFYYNNREKLNSFEFGYLRILSIYKNKNNIEYRYFEPIYNYENFKKISSKTFFGDKSYVKKRKILNSKNLVYEKK